jgi:rare lipoprotein A
MAKKIRVVALLLALAIGSTSANSSIASWYGPGFHGRLTANGERFNQWAMTAAHKTLPFGTLVRVTHGKRSVVVRINDRGPFTKGRTIDLSKGAALKIGCSGVCRVKLQVLAKK